jgi:hypothetical protein
MVCFHLALGSSSPKRAWDGSGAFSIRVSGRLIARFEASHVSVVRRHVRSKRRWHRDYLLAHLVPVVVRLSALVPPLGHKPLVDPIIFAHRQLERVACYHGAAGSRLGTQLNSRWARSAARSASNAAIAP